MRFGGEAPIPDVELMEVGASSQELGFRAAGRGVAGKKAPKLRTKVSRAGAKLKTRAVYNVATLSSRTASRFRGMEMGRAKREVLKKMNVTECH